MSDQHIKNLREASWRRKLTAGEEAELRAWVAANPEEQADWQSDVALNEQLDRLPDVPVSTNFTSRVLQAVEQETATTERKQIWTWPWQRFLPRAAAAAVVVGLSLVVYQQHQHQYQRTQRAELAVAVAGISQVVAAASDPVSSDPMVIQDFEVIRSLGDSSGPDRDLLALFQ